MTGTGNAIAIVKGLALGENGALRCGEGLACGSVGVCPLFKDEDGKVFYLGYEEALTAKTVKVSEVGDAGSVPELVLENTGSDCVLIVDGEQLVGAKQNRVLNTTVLIGPGSRIVIPVTCVEQGRWHYEHSRDMRGSREHLYARTRGRKSRQVTDSLENTMQYDSDQHDIWRNISSRLDDADVFSSTAAMEDHFASRRESLQRYHEAFSLEALRSSGEGVLCGAVFTLSGKVLGMDALNRGAAFEAQWPKLLNSYSIEAAPDNGPGGADAVEVRSFLTRAGRADMRVFQPPGLGDDVRLTGASLAGSALVHGGEVIHICAFGIDEEDGPALDRYRSNMSGYRARRRGQATRDASPPGM